MYIINDFFLLLWGEEIKEKFSSYGDIDSFLKVSLEKKYEIFCDCSTIVLTISYENIDRYEKIVEAKEAVRFFSGFDEWSKESIWFIQKEILSFLIARGNFKLKQDIEKRIDKLRKADIIGYEKARKIISLLSLIKEKRAESKPIVIEKAKSMGNFFDTSVEVLSVAIENLLNIIEDTNALSKIKEIPNKLKEQEFSIGITGVMNAGKSTMLNALLKSELLGTSVVPETANLTIIKYEKEPNAIVNFWTLQEWQDIEKSSEVIDSLTQFVDETKKNFQNSFFKYITIDGLSKKIDLKELPKYTSAELSNGMCNLVKSVELFTPLKFLKNGVSIVDTPGLDDPVIQREEITKQYLSECDLMIHLMNANQSATNKDVEFIVESLLYQNIARLLIVITRIDTISEDELEEVINYTKKSIKSRLNFLNKEHIFNSIIDKIDFIPISAYMALLHRTNRANEALQKGFDLEKTGISKVEKYLEDLLFGSSSQKAQLIIKSNQKELLRVINQAKNLFETELELLNKSKSEILNEYNRYTIEIQKVEKKLTLIVDLLKKKRDDLETYFLTLDRLISSKFNFLKEVIKRRVVDDFSYELRKNSTKPSESRISSIVKTALYDGLIDIFRDYRYEFYKRVDEAFGQVNREFEELKRDYKTPPKDTKEFFDQYFSKINLTKSNEILIKKINLAIKQSSKNDLDNLGLKIDKFLQEAFSEIFNEFMSKIESINSELIEEFLESSNGKISEISSAFENKKKLYEQSIKMVENSSYESKKRAQECNIKLKHLEIIERSLKEIKC